MTKQFLNIGFIFLCLISTSPIFSQADSLWGKYKLTEVNGVNYEGFALMPDSKAVLLKVYSNRFLYDHELPKDSLTIQFNPGLKKVNQFPVELSLVQPIEVKWLMDGDTLKIIDGDLSVSFRKFKTSYIVSASQIDGFTNSESPMYFQVERWDANARPISKLNILTKNKDQIPSNYDYYEYFEKMPEKVILQSVQGDYSDTLEFEGGNGSKILQLDSKSVKPKNNLFSNYELNRKRLAGYFYNTIHGYEYIYYHPTEIDGIYSGKKFLLKREGWFELGVKHGKWLYYDKTGNLIKMEIWKKGELKKTKEY